MPAYDSAPSLLATSRQVLTQNTPTTLTLPVDPNSVAHGLGVLGTYQPHHALITVENYPVRWGNPPDAFTGTLVAAGGTANFMDSSTDFFAVLRAIQFISASGPAVLQIQFYS